MSNTTAEILEIYTETTPNPGSLKFVTNRNLLPKAIADFKTKESAEGSALAWQLFEFPFVNGVFISNNFVTVSKPDEFEWYEIIPELKQFIKQHIEAGKPIVADKFFNKSGNTQEKGSIEEQIVELLDKYVRPAIEMDGGHIAFNKYEDNVVHLELQGSCSGCPSASLTLKGGVEGLLKRMIPEIKEVVAVEA